MNIKARVKSPLADYLAVLALLFLPAFLFAQQPPASAAQAAADSLKFALVIGNGTYTRLTPLANPVNDANDVAAALTDLGFTVEKVLDGDQDQMESAIIRLKNRLSVAGNSYGFLFYAGHGGCGAWLFRP